MKRKPTSLSATILADKKNSRLAFIKWNAASKALFRAYQEKRITKAQYEALDRGLDKRYEISRNKTYLPMIRKLKQERKAK
ncbi:MAG: hypothetical protein N2318_03400 [Meiothermus sp.]|uniref:hypothetical protein n=1 Tax=Meiothermus cerbereus TaxID=65552 RepID=UPI003EE961C8|nr:hypothetical protein [Meiothermus sp.]